MGFFCFEIGIPTVTVIVMNNVLLFFLKNKTKLRTVVYNCPMFDGS